MDGAIEEGPACGSLAKCLSSWAVLERRTTGVLCPLGPPPFPFSHRLHRTASCRVAGPTAQQDGHQDTLRVAADRLLGEPCSMPAMRRWLCCASVARMNEAQHWPACLQFYLEMDQVSEDFLWGRLQPLLDYLPLYQREKVRCAAPALSSAHGRVHMAFAMLPADTIACRPRVCIHAQRSTSNHALAARRHLS